MNKEAMNWSSEWRMNELKWSGELSKKRLKLNEPEFIWMMSEWWLTGLNEWLQKRITLTNGTEAGLIAADSINSINWIQQTEDIQFDWWSLIELMNAAIQTTSFSYEWNLNAFEWNGNENSIARRLNETNKLHADYTKMAEFKQLMLQFKN